MFSKHTLPNLTAIHIIPFYFSNLKIQQNKLEGKKIQREKLRKSDINRSYKLG